MKLSESFKNYLKDIDGYRSNKIESPNLSYKDYQQYSYGAPKGLLTLDEVRSIDYTLIPSKKDDIYKIYLSLELKNYQDIVENYLLNQKFLKQDLTINDIKTTSDTLLKNLTDYPFNFLFTQAFGEVWDKQTQKFIIKNTPGEFRSTNLVKGHVHFRPPIKIEENLEKILSSTQKILKSTKISKAEKIEALALFHLNYELLHPFAEGNGRTGRVLLAMLSLKAGILPPAFGVEKSEVLTGVKINPYYEEIEKVLLVKQKKNNWSLLSKVPKSFKDFYWISLDLTLKEGQNWLFKNQDQDLIKFYFSDYTKQQENEFLEFATTIKSNVQTILEKQKTQEYDYHSFGLSKEKER